MPQPPQHFPKPYPHQPWFKPLGFLSLLASSTLMAQAAQAWEPFPRRLMQSHLQTGLAQLRQTRVQPLAFIADHPLNPALSEGLEGRNLAQDISLLSQNPDSSVIEVSEVILTDVQIVGNQVLPLAVVNQIFAHQKNKPFNPADFQAGLDAINQWYQNNGYVLAHVVSAPRVSDQGVVTLEVVEGVIEAIQYLRQNEEGHLP